MKLPSRFNGKDIRTNRETTNSRFGHFCYTFECFFVRVGVTQSMTMVSLMSIIELKSNYAHKYCNLKLY